MMTLPEYQVIEHLYESANSLIYRATRRSDQQPVILKTLKENYPTPNELIRYRQEYELTSSLRLPGIIQAYELEKYQNTLVIVLEDFGGESLKYFLSRPLVPREFLKLALPIADSLGQLHTRQVIHKDINPANIVWNPSSREVKIIDLGISTRLSKEKTTFKSPQHLEGTLAYFSPEQTGRMNRDLDYRTDLYSLGVTFYELLTGQLPFTASDPLELLHCHLAKPVLPPHQLNPQVPPILSNIVMKLMAKNAEDRYQSAFGLQADLTQCLAHFDGLQSLTFTLAQKDSLGQMNIPQKLYGRTLELRTLLTAFERVSQGATELILVAGYSGVGKSSLVHEVHKPITAKAGYFISGKFDQYQRNIPYSAFATAFNEWCREVLTENEMRLVQWKGKILEAVGPNGQILIDVIPNLEHLIGPQPPVGQVGPQEAQNRFNWFFQRFIQAICQAEHPIVLLIDDWQWADFASINLCKTLLTDPHLRYFLVIGAYRDNEVDFTHPFIRSLEELRQQHVLLHTIEVNNLGKPEVEALLAETFQTPHIQALAELIEEKTSGNAFFVKTFLHTLNEEGLIYFTGQQWQWNLEAIHQKDLSDDVIVLLARQFDKLPPATQEILKLAATIGNRFELRLLSMIHQQLPLKTLEALWPALSENLLVPLDEHYKWVDEEERLEQATFRFQHDRIQQAAYSLISEAQRARFHRQLGLLLLLRHFSPDAQNKAIFEIVNHLNLGFKEPQDWQDLQYSTPQELAQLNLQAGQKAKASAAYASSLQYLQTGLTFLAESDWEQHYLLSLNLHTEAAEMAYLTGEYVLMEQLSERILSRAKNLLDKVKIYEVNIAAYATQGNYTKALDTGLFALGLLGVKLPSQPTRWDAIWGLSQVTWKLRGRQVKDLAYLPPLDNPTELAIHRLIVTMANSSYISRPLLFPVLITISLLRIMKYGSFPLASAVYGYYSVILCGLGYLEIGYCFGQLARIESLRWREKSIEGRVSFIFNYAVRHWKEPLRDGLFSLQEAYQNCLETGNLEMANYSLGYYCISSYCIGRNLISLEQELSSWVRISRQLKQEALSLETYHQLVLYLSGRGEIQNYEQTLTYSPPKYGCPKLAHTYLNQLIGYYLLEKFWQSYQAQQEVKKYLEGLRGSVHIPIFHWYSALLFLTLYTSASPSERRTFLKKVKLSQKKMKNWAHHAPANYLHKYLLVEAELARVLGKDKEAREYYDQAIAKAHENEFLHEEALASAMGD